MLYIVDDVTRECLAAIPDTSIARRRVAREVTALLERRGRETWHDRLRSWHGVHLGSHPCLIEGAQGRVALHRTGKADVRHGYVERCNGRMRDELLNESLFFGLSHARGPFPNGRRLQYVSAALVARIPHPGSLSWDHRRNRASWCIENGRGSLMFICKLLNHDSFLSGLVDESTHA